jgi:hypothetical protein
MRERRAESRKQRAESGNSIAAKRSKNRLTTDEYSFFFDNKTKEQLGKGDPRISPIDANFLESHAQCQRLVAGRAGSGQRAGGGTNAEMLKPENLKVGRRGGWTGRVSDLINHE